MDADVVVVEDRHVEHLVIARRAGRDDGILLADGDALLQRGVDLFHRDGDGVGDAQGLSVRQEGRRIGEPDRHTLEVVGLADFDVLRRECAVPEEPPVDDFDAGRLLEGREQSFRAIVDPVESVVGVVECVCGIDDTDRLVRGAQRRGPLQVDVDVAGLDEREAIRVGTELASRKQLDREADVGLLETLLEQLDPAVVVRRLLVLAGRDGERDGLGGATLGGVPSAAAGDDEGGCCEH